VLHVPFDHICTTVECTGSGMTAFEIKEPRVITNYFKNLSA
jgi:hypothetical protein